ncbi:MAG TPA: hypothetical protein VM580_19910 [Labilithrix sp.]|nr:hypothetical protein [Labilithrix sp.]
MRPILTLVAVSAAALLACGGAQPPPSPPAAGGDSQLPADAHADAGSGDSQPGESAPQASHFDSLSKDKKLEIMASKVVPSVGKLFKEHNKAKFEKFGCATCHGPEKKDPRQFLPKLALSNGGFEQLSKAKPEMMAFMAEKVVPAMAAALGEQPYDPATKKGFGCGGCHTVE